MNNYWKYLVVVAAAGMMTVGCDSERDMDNEASWVAYKDSYEVERREGVNEEAEDELAEVTEIETDALEFEFEFETDEEFDTEFEDTPGAMADRGTAASQVEERQPRERGEADRAQAEDLAGVGEEPVVQWDEADQPDEFGPLTEDERPASIEDEVEIAVGELEPAADIDIDDEPRVIDDEEDDFVFDDALDDDGQDVLTVDEPRRMGMGFMVGGGVNNYVNDLDAVTNTGGNWDVRAILGTNSRLAGEVAYHGTANGIGVLGMDNGAVLMSNGAEGAARVNLLTKSLQPYVLGGIGWKHLSIENTDTNTSNVANRANAMTVPVGAGLAYKFGNTYADVRGMYRPSFLSNMVQDADGNDASFDTISGSLNLGFLF